MLWRWRMMVFKLVFHMGDYVIDSDHGLLKPCANDSPLSGNTIPDERHCGVLSQSPSVYSRRHLLASLLTHSAISYSSE